VDTIEIEVGNVSVTPSDEIGGGGFADAVGVGKHLIAEGGAGAVTHEPHDGQSPQGGCVQRLGQGAMQEDAVELSIAKSLGKFGQVVDVGEEQVNPLAVERVGDASQQVLKRGRRPTVGGAEDEEGDGQACVT
jgi:hypothetical protein